MPWLYVGSLVTIHSNQLPQLLQLLLASQLSGSVVLLVYLIQGPLSGVKLFGSTNNSQEFHSEIFLLGNLALKSLLGQQTVELLAKLVPPVLLHLLATNMEQVQFEIVRLEAMSKVEIFYLRSGSMKVSSW